MKAVVVYESMYGNTHLVADAIGAACAKRAAESDEIVVVPVGSATPRVLAGADLIVVGGPTHTDGMSRLTRPEAAVAAVDTSRKALWRSTPMPKGRASRVARALDGLGALPNAGGRVDTRMDAPPLLTGRASQGIARRLRNAGCHLVAVPRASS